MSICEEERMGIIIKNIVSLQHGSKMNETMLARETGISRGSLSRYKKLKWFISLKNLVACTSVFDIHISGLLLTREEILNELGTLEAKFPPVSHVDTRAHTPYTYKTYSQVLANNIFYTRHKKGLSLKDLERSTNGVMTYMSFNRYENGISPTHPRTIIPVSQILETTVIELTSKTGDIPHIIASLKHEHLSRAIN